MNKSSFILDRAGFIHLNMIIPIVFKDYLNYLNPRQIPMRFDMHLIFRHSLQNQHKMASE